MHREMESPSKQVTWGEENFIVTQIATKGNVVTLCSHCTRDHDRTIEKNKRSEADLSNLALKAFN
jgi:hypothetical protein